MRGEILRGGPEILEPLAEEWRRLCDELGNDLPFTRPEWVDAYFRCNTGIWVIAVLRQDDRLVAVLPLIEKRAQISRLPATVLRMPSDFHLCPFDIPIAPDLDRLSAARKLWEILREGRNWDILELPNIPQGGFTEELFKVALNDDFQSHRWEYMHSPFIKLEGMDSDRDPLTFAKSRNLRANIRKATRRLRQKGRVRIAIIDSAQNDVLSRMYELENASWKGRAGSSIAARQKDINFWNKVAHAGAEFGYLSLCSISMANVIVAVSLGFSYKKNYFGIKMGWDESLKDFSLGHMLVLEILGKCIDKGLKNFYLGGLRSAWKEQWTDRFLPHTTFYLFRGSAYGRALKWAKLRQIEELKTSFVPNQGVLEGCSAKAKPSPVAITANQRVFFAPTTPGLGIRNILPIGRSLSHFPFNRVSTEYFYNARSAIYTLAKVLKLGGKEVLFPSYCCGVDLEALLAAEAVVKFYPVRSYMRIDASDIVSRLGPKTKAVYLIHYLGFPSPVEELVSICRARGVSLIEDCALSLFSRIGGRELGTFGDAAVFSLYKSLPVPSGGVLVLNDGIQHKLPHRRFPPLRSTLAHLRLLFQRTFDMNDKAWGRYGLEAARRAVKTVRPSVAEKSVIEIMTEKFDTNDSSFRMSRVSEWIVRSVDPNYIVKRRRENFAALNQTLRDLANPVFDNLPEGVCPLFYAIKVEDNKKTMRALREEGVEAWAWWWPMHPKLAEAPCAEAQTLRRQVVVIPCHEGIRLKVVERVAQVVIKALKKRAR